MFDITSVTSYTAGTDTVLISGQTGYTTIVRSVYITNTNTSDEVRIDIKQANAVVASILVPAQDTAELLSFILVKPNYDLKFNASAAGLHITVYSTTVNNNVFSSFE